MLKLPFFGDLMIYKFYWERPDGEGHVYDEKFIIAVVEDTVRGVESTTGGHSLGG
jgi:hypothetical protein